MANSLDFTESPSAEEKGTAWADCQGVPQEAVVQFIFGRLLLAAHVVAGRQKAGRCRGGGSLFRQFAIPAVRAAFACEDAK